MILGYRVKEKKISINTILPNYYSTRKEEEKDKFAFAISNHVSSWMDVFYYITKPFSYVSRSIVAKDKFMGVFGIARQTIFINRSSQLDKEKQIKIMKKRIPLIMEGKMPPLFIYPEGTTTNGEAIMKFKKGAFTHKEPIKIFAVRYNGEFLPSFNNLHRLLSIIIAITQINSLIEVYEIEEPLDPLWVAKEYGIDENDPELWRKVAEVSREVMSFVTGLQLVESGFKELIDFEESECVIVNQKGLGMCGKKCKMRTRKDRKTDHFFKESRRAQMERGKGECEVNQIAAEVVKVKDE